MFKSKNTITWIRKKKSDIKSKNKKENIKAEEEFKRTFGEALRDKSVDEKINYYLEKINSDNYDIKSSFRIKDSDENQNKFIDSAIKISILKSPFIEI